MTTHALDKKMAEIRNLACDAINNRLKGTGYDMARCLIDMWAESNGVIVLHLNSGGNSTVVAHALWNRYSVKSDLHPEYGVLVWVD